MADGIFLIFPVKRAAFLLSFPVLVYCFSVFAKTYTLSFFHCLFRFLCMFLFVILQLFLFPCKRLQALNKKELLLTVLNHTERVLCVFVTSASLQVLPVVRRIYSSWQRLCFSRTLYKTLHWLPIIWRMLRVCASTS